ncbi:LamG domain-containing protein [Streptacidiphilus monticola]
MPPQQPYGYPQQQPAPLPYPQAQPYGYPPPPGVPGTVPVAPSEPDWNLLAQQHEDRKRRNRRIGFIAGAVAVLLVAGGVTALALKGNGQPQAQGSSSPSASASGSAAGSASPSAPPTKQGPPPGPATAGSVPAAAGSTPLGLGTQTHVGKAPGFNGKALLLPSGQDSFAATSAQMVPTDGSFTVSARARSDAPTGNRSVVSQGSSGFYSFSLGRVLDSGANHWVFKVQLPGGGSKAVMSKGAAAVGQFTVVTGVYDAGAHRIALYVNGALQDQTQVPGVRESAGGLQIGRVRSSDQWVDPWRGQIADIQVWKSALTAGQVVKVAAGTAVTPGPDHAWLVH